LEFSGDGALLLPLLCPHISEAVPKAAISSGSQCRLKRRLERKCSDFPFIIIIPLKTFRRARGKSVTAGTQPCHALAMPLICHPELRR